MRTDQAHGPGILDMKAGLVIAVYVLKALHEYGYDKRPIRVVFAGDEENREPPPDETRRTRSRKTLCRDARRRSTLRRVLDDGLVDRRKGSCE